MARDPYQLCALPVQIAAHIRTHGADGTLVEAWLTRDADSPARRRGESKYTLELGLSWAPMMGLVLLVDARGYAKKFNYRAAAEWLGKNMSGSAVYLRLNVRDSSSVPPAWTKKRVESLDKSVAAVDLPALLAAAQAKRATVAEWLDSPRKTAVLDAARVVDWCDYFARTTAPGGALGADRSGGPHGGESGVIVVPDPDPVPDPEPAPAPGWSSVNLPAQDLNARFAEFAALAGVAVADSDLTGWAGADGVGLPGLVLPLAAAGVVGAPAVAVVGPGVVRWGFAEGAVSVPWEYGSASSNVVGLITFLMGLDDGNEVFLGVARARAVSLPGAFTALKIEWAAAGETVVLARQLLVWDMHGGFARSRSWSAWVSGPGVYVSAACARGGAWGSQWAPWLEDELSTAGRMTAFEVLGYEAGVNFVS